MTAHTKITGTRVLVAPAHIRGPIRAEGSEALKRERAAWIASLPASATQADVAAALGITKTPAGSLLRRHRPAVAKIPNRSRVRTRGLRAGRVEESMMSYLTWEQQDALEAHCARTGQAITDALVELWATVHAGERA